MRSPGFTLIEILISAVIFLMAVMVALSAFSASVGSQSRSDDVQITSQASKFSLEAISLEARRASGLLTDKMFSGTTNTGIVAGFAIVDETEQEELISDINTGLDANVDGIAHGKRLLVALSLDEDEQYVFFRKVDQNGLGSLERRLVNETDAQSVAITPAELNVKDFRLLSPVPALTTNALVSQPFVEMVLEIAPSKSLNDQQFTTTTLRTTVTSGYYGIKTY